MKFYPYKKEVGVGVGVGVGIKGFSHAEGVGANNVLR